MESGTENNLAVLWVSRDKEAALNMAFMYAKNSKLKNWWAQVRLIVWGPSAPLLVNDKDLQAELEELKKAGVELQACKACADRYQVGPRLEQLGVDVIYMGQPLTHYLKNGWTVLTV
ncbi:MAG: DsrE family protein [Thermodesulfobacteriota bacterium]